MKLHCWAMLLALALTGHAPAKTLRIGLVAGHNRGLESDVRLQYAEADAQKMAELFQDVGGMDEDNLILLKSPRPEDLDQAFRELHALGAKAGPGDEVVFLFYFSGHGTSDHLKLGRKTYPLKDLKERIDQVPAKLRIGILDACQSGAITRLKGARLVQPFVLEQQLKSQGSILIASSAEDENSQESELLQGSFFTHNLMSALRGAGDVSGDRRVTLLEAYQFAFQRTLVQTGESRGGAQHAKARFNLDVEGDVVLTDLNTGRGGFVFQPGMEGELLIADGYSQVVGEFRKEKGREAFLALPAGTYRIFQKLGNKTLQTRVKLKDRQIREVRPEDMASGFRSEGLAKGGHRDEDVSLPWRVQDWPTQYPLEFGLGFINGSHPVSAAATVGYRFLPPFALTGTYIVNKLYGKGFFEGDDQQEFRLGLQGGKFLSRNIEFQATLFQRAAFRSERPRQTCPDSPSDRCEYVPGSPSWHAGEGTGTVFGMRFWIWSRLSLSLSYGTEYTWREGKFNAASLMILPGLHF